MNYYNFKPNPYIFGHPIYKKEQLFGRENTVKGIKKNIKNNKKITLLYVQRRIGKTSLITCLSQFFTDDIKFVTFSFQGYKYSSISEILNHLADDIVVTLDQVPREVIELANAPYNFFNLFLPTIINEYLFGENLVILVDEFDVLEEDKTMFTRGKYLFNELKKAVNQEEKLFTILVFGRPLKDMTYLEEFLQKEGQETIIEVGLLDKKSTYNLIVEPARGTLEYEADAVNAIWQLSAGHPSLTQLLCFCIFNYCKEKEIKKATRNHVLSIIDEAMERGQPALKGFLGPLNENEKLFFRAVAEAQESFQEKQLKTIIRNWQSVGKRLVEEYGFLEEKEDGTGYKIKVELVRRWLVKNYPLSDKEKLQMEKNP
jgi:hypothetical protein